MINQDVITVTNLQNSLSATLFEQAVVATKQTQKEAAENLIKVLVGEVISGTVTWNRNLTTTITEAIKRLDEIISKQLAKIMHQEKFKKLEGSWRGLHYLTQNSETSLTLKIKVFNATKTEIANDLEHAVEFDQSQTFKKVYETEFGSPGGEPYSALIGDYEFTNEPCDIDHLANMAKISAAGFCPFISSASPIFFGFDSWKDLAKPRDLAKIFDSVEYAKWKALRESEDSRFVSLVMPRVLARLPYGKNTKKIDAFDFEEIMQSEFGTRTRLPHFDYCWMNAAYVLGTKLTDAFARYGWCTAIRGAESGGKIDGLPLHIFPSDDGDIDSICPTEIGITDRREAELSNLGLLPLCHYKNSDYAVIFGAQTIQKPKIYDEDSATGNAKISARLPYILATGRFAHYLKVMARDKIGSFMQAHDVEEWLNRWILNYVNGNKMSGQEMKARYPLAEAKVIVEEIPGKPGSYNAIAWLKPWMQMEELTTSLRLVAQIPKLG